MSTIEALQKQLEIVLKFPDQNPNPVLKIKMDGTLLYSNGAGTEIHQAWDVGIGGIVPPEIVAHTKLNSHAPLDMLIGHKTFSFHIVPVPEFDFICIYGTDITAMKAITKFPDHNPNPVLKISREGKLLYVNKAGMEIQKAWVIENGERVPETIDEFSKKRSTDPI